MSFERIVELTPAYDKRSNNPAENYGIHGVELRMVLKGAEGAVQFVLYTNWHLPHVARELKSRRLEPLPADLGYHSPCPMYDSQQPSSEACRLEETKVGSQVEQVNRLCMEPRK